MIERIFVVVLVGLLLAFGCAYVYANYLPLEITVRVRVDAGSVMIMRDCPVVSCEYDAGPIESLDGGFSSGE